MTNTNALPQSFTAKGVNGQLIVTPTKVIIQRKGLFGIMMQQGNKEIRLDQISAIQLRKPGLTRGFIRISFLGGQESKRGTVYNAASDENAIVIAAGQTKQFEQAKTLIEQYQQVALTARHAPQVMAPPPSAADELAKLAELRDQGVLTEDEFAAKKKQVLGL
ncbi:MAG TPA: SHOCT domain-containing protein [Ktedonobacterales bacterium]|nr:SHOCT domain-containing protein [Ktedonobacterales bacterium]